MLLLDTDILIDCLRGVSAARAWLESAATEAFGIPGIVAMELLVGCSRNSWRLLSFFGPMPPSPRALTNCWRRIVLATGVGIPDCVIAAMALGRHTPLCTFNRKHFQIFAGLEVREPYQRG